jgi:hypothetical protein
VFTGVEWDSDTVSNFFLIVFSILTDIALGHVACFLWVNSLTSRVPFASVTGATRYAPHHRPRFPLHDRGSTSPVLLCLEGPVPGVDAMAKRSQGWVKCEDHLPYYRNQK